MFKSIKQRIFPTIIALSALSVSASAAFYSVTGLSKLFAGATMQVIIMAGSLEFAKLVIASLLYQYWDKLNKALKVYLSIATFVLVLITSMGIYGFLSAAYQETASQAGIVEKQVALLELKKDRFENDRIYYKSNKESVSEDIAELRKALSSGTTVQYVDKETGQVITTTSRATRQAFEKQLDIAMGERNAISRKLEEVTDSVSTIELKILEVESKAETTSELGPLKYISKITGMPMDEIVNLLLLTIIFVFDPLAISLVIAANYAFDQLGEKKKPQPTRLKSSIPKPNPKKEIIELPSEYDMELKAKKFKKVMDEENNEVIEEELEEGSIPGVKGDYVVKESQKENEGGITGKHTKVTKDEWLKAAKKKNDGENKKP